MFQKIHFTWNFFSQSTLIAQSVSAIKRWKMKTKRATKKCRRSERNGDLDHDDEQIVTVAQCALAFNTYVQRSFWIQIKLKCLDVAHLLLKRTARYVKLKSLSSPFIIIIMQSNPNSALFNTDKHNVCSKK